MNEGPSIGLSDSLRRAGFKLGRLQTGTPARLASNSIDFSKLTRLEGDKNPQPFSYVNRTVDNAVCKISSFSVYDDLRFNRIIK